MSNYSDRIESRVELSKLENVAYDFSDKCREELRAKAKMGIRGWDDPAKFSDEKLMAHLSAAVKRKDAIAISNYAMFLFYRTHTEEEHSTNDFDAVGGAGW